MEIAAQLTQLAEMSNIEEKMRAARLQVETLPAVAQKAKDEASAKEQVKNGHERTQIELEKTRRGLESDVHAERDKLRKWQTRADNIRGEREHAALQSEIGAQKRSIGYLENKQLETMQELEDIAKTIEKATKEFDDANAFAESEWAKVSADVEKAQAEHAKFEIARDAILEKLPKSTISRYQRSAKRRKTAVAIVKNGICMGCRTKVRPQLVLMLHRGSVIESCETCQRILVHESMTHADAGA